MDGTFYEKYITNDVSVMKYIYIDCGLLFIYMNCLTRHNYKGFCTSSNDSLFCSKVFVLLALGSVIKEVISHVQIF